MNLQAYIVEVSEQWLKLKYRVLAKKEEKKSFRKKEQAVIVVWNTDHRDTMKECQSTISVFNVAIGLLLVSNMKKS